MMKYSIIVIIQKIANIYSVSVTDQTLYLNLFMYKLIYLSQWCIDRYIIPFLKISKVKVAQSCLTLF